MKYLTVASERRVVIFELSPEYRQILFGGKRFAHPIKSIFHTINS